MHDPQFPHYQSISRTSPTDRDAPFSRPHWAVTFASRNVIRTARLADKDTLSQVGPSITRTSRVRASVGIFRTRHLTSELCHRQRIHPPFLTCSLDFLDGFIYNSNTLSRVLLTVVEMTSREDALWYPLSLRFNHEEVSKHGHSWAVWAKARGSSRTQAVFLTAGYPCSCFSSHSLTGPIPPIRQFLDRRFILIV